MNQVIFQEDLPVSFCNCLLSLGAAETFLFESPSPHTRRDVSTGVGVVFIYPAQRPALPSVSSLPRDLEDSEPWALRTPSSEARPLLRASRRLGAELPSGRLPPSRARVPVTLSRCSCLALFLAVFPLHPPQTPLLSCLRAVMFLVYGGSSCLYLLKYFKHTCFHVPLKSAYFLCLSECDLSPSLPALSCGA